MSCSYSFVFLISSPFPGQVLLRLSRRLAELVIWLQELPVFLEIDLIEPGEQYFLPRTLSKRGIKFVPRRILNQFSKRIYFQKLIIKNNLR